jgi:uncharacterized protein (DUF1501 family)
MFCGPIDRRGFLARSSLIAFAPTVPSFLGRTARAAQPASDGRTLVVIQLSGGNDGINTVVPYADEGYARNREKLRIDKNQLITLNDQVGLHPSLRPMAELLDDQRLAIVQGVGYPNPNRSHDVSMAIWHTARFEPTEHKSFGWIGRAMDEAPTPANGSPHMMLVGTENPPVAIRGRRSTSVALAHLQDLQLLAKSARGAVDLEALRSQHPDDLASFVQRSALDAYDTAELLEAVTQPRGAEQSIYPSTQLADRLKMISQLIKADFGTPVFYAVQDGYDTHAAQLPTHARLLRELAGALKSFLDDLKAARVDERVLVLVFSEFGRRVEENASLGTDHGTAAPVFLAGAKVRAGLIGAAPLLTDLDDGDLKMGIDFRQVYASLLQDWLGLSSGSAIGESFAPLGLIKV